MSNPVLTRQFGENRRNRSTVSTSPPIVTTSGERMSMGGTVRATGTLFGLVLIGSVFGWLNAEALGGILLVGLLVMFGVVVATMFRPRWVTVTGPIYALVQGAFIGAISNIYATFYEGIVLQAVLATGAVFVAMLFLYANRIIKVTQRLRSTVILATAGIALFYLISIGLSLFGVNIPLVWESGPLGIGISLLIVGVAAFNLLLDFDLIERGINEGAEGWMDWFAAFGLMVTIIWLYLEILRLIALVSGRD